MSSRKNDEEGFTFPQIAGIFALLILIIFLIVGIAKILPEKLF